MSVFFGGDVVTGEIACELDLPFEVLVINLEGPVVQGNTPGRSKAGPLLFSRIVPQFGGHLVVNLANNHFMDFGVDGADETIGLLRDNGISYVGYGRDVHEARNPLVFECSIGRVGIIGACEAQFGVASAWHCGVAEKGIWIFEAIDKLRKQVDFIGVSIHGGFEISPWPSPSVQDEYRLYIDAGANLVHGHHSHVPQGVEYYSNGIILYGAGNLGVDPRKWNHMAHSLWSGGVEVSSPNTYTRLRTRQYASEGRIVVNVDGIPAAGEIRSYIADCDRPLCDRALLESIWQTCAVYAYENYYEGYLRFQDVPKPQEGTIRRGYSAIRHTIKQWLYPRQTPEPLLKNQLLLWYHLFACETHRDLIRQALGLLSGEIQPIPDGQASQLVNKYITK